METGEVARAVVRVVLEGESRVSRIEPRATTLIERQWLMCGAGVRVAQHIIEPAYSRALPLLRALPTWVYHLAIW